MPRKSPRSIPVLCGLGARVSPRATFWIGFGGEEISRLEVATAMHVRVSRMCICVCVCVGGGRCCCFPTRGEGQSLAQSQLAFGQPRRTRAVASPGSCDGVGVDAKGLPTRLSCNITPGLPQTNLNPLCSGLQGECQNCGYGWRRCPWTPVVGWFAPPSHFQGPGCSLLPSILLRSEGGGALPRHGDGNR